MAIGCAALLAAMQEEAFTIRSGAQARPTNVDRHIAYLDIHRPSTPSKDLIELRAVREVFGDNMPAVSSTNATLVFQRL
jgi:3-oxoacyl-(acyl-carrier-protein) synthase